MLMITFMSAGKAFSREFIAKLKVYCEIQLFECWFTRAIPELPSQLQHAAS